MRRTTAMLADRDRMTKKFQDSIDRKLHDEIVALEREFNVALSVNARREGDGSGKELAAKVESLERRASRQAEHLARLQDKLAAMERG